MISSLLKSQNVENIASIIGPDIQPAESVRSRVPAAIRVKIEKQNNNLELPTEDECKQVDKSDPVSGPQPTAPVPVTGDDGIQVVGERGAHAGRDYPHARFSCLVYPFNSSVKSQHCAQCYCYVCDVPVKQCTGWQQHCVAEMSVLFWRQERAKRKSFKP